MKRLPYFLAAATLAGACTETDPYAGEEVKSDNGKADASALGVFLDAQFDGKLVIDSSWNDNQTIQDQLLYTVGQLNGMTAVGRIDKVVLTNVQNLVDTVGWKNIEALELVVHGPGLRPFIARTIDPDVKGKVETLLTAGMTMGACQITMKRQSIKPEELIDGLVPIPSGVVRVMELEEKGYAYIRP